jgi:predicted ATPase/transcriptional regulator with XRE-family HTH domain
MVQQIPSFSDLLRRYRREKGLTQEELAAQSGLSMEAISAMERGVTQWPYRATVALLAEALALAPAERRMLETMARRPARHGAGAAASQAGSSGVIQARQAALAPTGQLPVTDSLPMPLTALIGREHELAAIRRALCQSAVRLLTLTGAGGIGKTRLAIEAGAALRADFTDGVIFIALDALRDPGLVPAAIARALRVSEASGSGLLASIIEYLREKRILLVLDNAEHLVAVAPLVVDLLAACPGLKVLVTSRAVLRVRGEHEMVVPPLAVSGAGHGTTESGLDVTGATPLAPAVALFIERAVAVRADLVIDEQTMATVTAICARLDGLPLAIELAAARVRLLSPDVLLARLNRRLDLLTDGPRDLPARQQTLRSAIAWSYELLEPDEKLLFGRLAIFAGTWPLEAAEAVCAGEAHADTFVGTGGLALAQ